MRYLTSLAIVLGLASAQPVLAGDLAGTVSDSTALPVAGMTVSLPELGLKTRTDAEGAYRFQDLPEGEYEVAVSLGEEAVQFSSASVPAEGVAKRNIFLLSRTAVTAARTGMTPGEAAEAAKIEREAMQAAEAMLREAGGEVAGELLADAARG